MSVTQSLGKSWFLSGLFFAVIAAGSATTTDVLGAEGSAESTATSPGTDWTVHRPITPDQSLPLARLVRNPDQSDIAPAYALADQSGTIQRYVEAVPGIDLEPYVGYAVKVRHDTGRTLLATQLALPGQEPELPENAAPSDVGVAESSQPVINSLFQGILDAPTDSSGVQAAQYAPAQYPPMQYAPAGGAPVMIQQGASPMMAQQGMVTYDPMSPAMGGAPMGAYPPGADPIFLDSGAACGPQGCPAPCATCPQPQMYMQPVAPCPPPVPCCPPPPAPKWALWGDALWIHPTGVDMAHAQQQNGIGGAGTVPFGEIGVVDPDYDLGFRIGGEVRYAPKEAIFLQYAWFETDASSSLVAPDIPGGGGAIGSLVHHPGAALTASAGPVDATYDIKFQLAEAAYRYFVTCSRTGEVTVFLGGRWGKLEQAFAQTGIFSGGLGGTVDTTTNIDFDGAGPIAGVTGEHLIGDSRFTVYGRAQAAALTGTFDSHYRMNNSTTATLLAESNWSDDRIVPMLDYELGVAWIGPQGHFRVAVGYLASFWFNAVTTPVWVDAVQADNYVDVSDTIAFDGAVGRVECRW